MNSRPLVLCLVLAAAGLAPRVAQGGIVYLKNGEEIEGRIVAADDFVVTLITTGGKLHVDRRQVQAVELANDDPITHALRTQEPATAPAAGPDAASEEAAVKRAVAEADEIRLEARARRDQAVEEGGLTAAPRQMRRGDIALGLADDAFKTGRHAVARKKYEDARGAYSRAITAALEARKRDPKKIAADRRRLEETLNAMDRSRIRAATDEKRKEEAARKTAEEERARRRAGPDGAESGSSPSGEKPATAEDAPRAR